LQLAKSNGKKLLPTSGNWALKWLALAIVHLNTPVVLILDDHQENILIKIKAGRIDCVIFKPFGLEDIQKAVQYFF